MTQRGFLLQREWSTDDVDCTATPVIRQRHLVAIARCEHVDRPRRVGRCEDPATVLKGLVVGGSQLDGMTCPFGRIPTHGQT